MKILNLTKNTTTPEQQAQGVFEPSPQDKADIKRLLTFEGWPSERYLMVVAVNLAVIAESYCANSVLVEGSFLFLNTIFCLLKVLAKHMVHSIHLYFLKRFV